MTKHASGRGGAFSEQYKNIRKHIDDAARLDDIRRAADMLPDALIEAEEANTRDWERSL